MPPRFCYGRCCRRSRSPRPWARGSPTRPSRPLRRSWEVSCSVGAEWPAVLGLRRRQHASHIPSPSAPCTFAGVVGGLTGLTLCLAAALLLAVARICEWSGARGAGRLRPSHRARRAAPPSPATPPTLPRHPLRLRLPPTFADGWGWHLGLSRLKRAKHATDSPPASATITARRRMSDVEAALETSRRASDARLPAIVTSRLARSSSEAEVEAGGAFGAVAGGGGSPASQAPATGRSGVASPLRSDSSWKDCLIKADKIQILRRRDGKPWVLGGGAYGQVGAPGRCRCRCALENWCSGGVAVPGSPGGLAGEWGVGPRAGCCSAAPRNGGGPCSGASGAAGAGCRLAPCAAALRRTTWQTNPLAPAHVLSDRCTRHCMTACRWAGREGRRAGGGSSSGTPAGTAGAGGRGRQRSVRCGSARKPVCACALARPPPASVCGGGSLPGRPRPALCPV